MIKIAHNLNKYKYIIGVLIIIFVTTLIIYLKERNIYIYYDTNITYCKNLNEYEKKEYLICYKNNEYSFVIKDKQPIKVINHLKKIKITSIENLFSNAWQNKNLFLVVMKGNQYEILPVKMYQNLS